MAKWRAKRPGAMDRRSTLPKAVIFDVGRVLFQWDLRHLFRKLIPDTVALEYFVTHVVTPAWHFQHDAGRDLDPMLAERIAEFPEFADLIRAYRTRFNETIPGPMPDMLELVTELSDAGVRLFVISNFGDEFWNQFRPTQPIFDRFDGLIISGKEKLMKPDPAIYRLALERFLLTADEALFVDDVPANVAAAKSVGIETFLFEGDAAAFRTWLRARGMPV
jgi:2-haloacid dehalogenase